MLLGHSYGCHVAALVAAARPEQVSALVFLGPAFDRRFGPPLAGAAAPDGRRDDGAPVAGGVRRPRLPPLRPKGSIIETTRAANIPLDRLVGGVRSHSLIDARQPRHADHPLGEDLRRSAGPARVAVIRPRPALELAGRRQPAVEAFLAAH